MKHYFIFFPLLFFVFILLIGCGGSKVGIKPIDDEVTKIETKFGETAAAIIKNGGVAAVGDGISERRDIAKDKALIKAQSQLAEIFEMKISRLSKLFVEEVGSEDTEINEAYSNVIRKFSTTTLRGAIPSPARYLMENGKYTAFILVSIDPKTLNQSLLDEMKSNPKLYQRYISTKAHEELLKEIDKYEQQEKEKQESFK